MRILMTGGGDMGRITAEALISAGHDVVLIEEGREVCERLAEALDIMVICGDATNPDILEKAEIEKADILIALSGSDKMNILTSIIAKEYGVKRIIVRLDDPAFNAICRKFGVEEIINPKTATAKHIAYMIKTPRALEISTLVGGDIRAFTAIIKKEEHGGKKTEDLALPSDCLPVVVKRDKEFFIARAGFKVLKGDSLTILCEEKSLDALGKIFG